MLVDNVMIDVLFLLVLANLGLISWRLWRQLKLAKEQFENYKKLEFRLEDILASMPPPSSPSLSREKDHHKKNPVFISEARAVEIERELEAKNPHGVL